MNGKKVRHQFFFNDSKNCILQMRQFRPCRCESIDPNISGYGSESSPNGYHPMIRIQRGHREEYCKILQNGQRKLEKNGGTQTNFLWRNPHRSSRIVSSQTSPIESTQGDIFPKIQIVRFASVREKQELVGHANKKISTYTARSLQPSQDPQWSRRIAEQSEVWPLIGINVIHAKQKLHKKRRASLGIFSNQKKTKMIHTRNSLVLGKDCEDLGWNHRQSALHRPDIKWNCRKGSERSQRGHCIYLNAVWTR